MSERGRTLAPATILAGRYRIERVLGRGGMGAVYVATRLDLDRRVAVKIVDAAAGAEAIALEATEREARAAARLAHPHIVQVIDFARGEGGEPPFFVMELLEGEPLDARLERAGALPPGTAALVLVQVLSALAAAHASGILHRDVKPANVFLTETAAGFDFVKLLDFGVAANLSLHASLRGEALAGTPSHMAPEQVRGERLDARTDVWGAGVTLYEMLTGRLPFDGPNVAALLANVCHAAPLPLPSDLDPALAAVVLRALAKEPEDRFPSAEAMRAALAPLAVVGAVPSRDRLGAAGLALAPTERDPSAPDARATTLATTAQASAPAATDPGSTRDRTRPNLDRTVPSGPGLPTLASGAAHTMPPAAAAAPARRDVLGLVNVACAVAFVAVSVLVLAAGHGRTAPPGVAAARAPTCALDAPRTAGANLATLDLAADDRGLVLVGTRSGPPGLFLAELPERDGEVVGWPATLFDDAVTTATRFFTCAPRAAIAGAALGFSRSLRGERFRSTFARLERPPLPGNGRQRITARQNRYPLDALACAGAGSLTVLGSLGQDPETGMNVHLLLLDGPRMEDGPDLALDGTTSLALDTDGTTLALLALRDHAPNAWLVDVRTLGASATLPLDEPTARDELAVAATPAGLTAVWVREAPRALVTAELRRSGDATPPRVLVTGDIAAPALARRADGLVLAWLERAGGTTRLRVGHGPTPAAAVAAAVDRVVGPDARAVRVTGGAPPWVGWIEGGSAQVTQLSCED